MRMRRAQEKSMGLARTIDIIRVVALAGDEALDRPDRNALIGDAVVFAERAELAEEAAVGVGGSDAGKQTVDRVGAPQPSPGPRA